MTDVAIDSREPDISDWAGSPLSTVHPVGPAILPIPIEQYPDGRDYVIRLELPGIDPAEDLHVCEQTGILSVQAERRDQTPATHDSEFQYGSYARHIALPLGFNEGDVRASYHTGILTIRIGMKPEHDSSPHPVQVETQ